MSSRASTSGALPCGPCPIQRVLIVDPDEPSRRALHIMLDRRGLEVIAVPSADAARRWLADGTCDVILAEASLLDDMVGGPPVIAMTPPRDAGAGVRALEAGAADCVLGVPDESALMLALHRVARGGASNGHGNGHKNGAKNGHGHGNGHDPGKNGHGNGHANGHGTAIRMIGNSDAMRRLDATIRRIAPHRTTVLVTGESGTGKELVARAIHDASPRAPRRFVAINCAAIPAALLESELFGHKRGAFTDAVRDKTGLFEDADGGTLFLDEVGELPLALQAKLLRAIQEHEIRRVGDVDAVRIDVRVVAATLRDLAADVQAGAFREDLYYRLNVLPVQVPPLRERPDDIPALVDHFRERFRERHGAAAELTAEAVALLMRHSWPGNVRELENTVERALVLAEGEVVDPCDLAALVGNARDGAAGARGDDPIELSIKKATRALEVELIRRALETTQGNRTNAARLLEISHRALLYKIKEYGL